MTRLFISHCTHDDDFVRDLHALLADHGQEGWIDSRELRGGDRLWSEIQRTIEAASAYAVVVSPEALQSTWVGKELRHALGVAAKRGKGKFPVIPIALNGTKLGVLEQLFDEEPLYVPVSSRAGGVEAAMNAILVALGERLPAEIPPGPQPETQPLEELVLELTDLKVQVQDGMRRASARARLVYVPATLGQPQVNSARTWRLVAPVGPIEAKELRWYLEKYAIWPSHYFRSRARKLEVNLVRWGQLLHQAAMPVVHTANVMNAWGRIGSHAGRRFSVYVDTALEDGGTEADTQSAQEAATELFTIPWELLHGGDGYLFQGAKPTRVRRRLPNTNALFVPAVAIPIRILLISARPDDDVCGYIDHRTSALPLVEAMECLPGLVKIHVLSPPTLPACRAELQRARDEHKPYHVVHFDGHGVYSTQIGLGGLCFEHPTDVDKLEKRRHVTVYTKDGAEYGTGLESLMRDHRIPLVFLEACQTAQAEKASGSVASELLKVGVGSVVAMSHSVLVETGRRFVEAFYRALAGGKRVGDAMLAGQRQLKDDTFRGPVFGGGGLRLEDWFVPVLFQDKHDPQLFNTIPGKQTQADFRAALAARLGELPTVPETGFVGRSRELLALQRLLRHERYAVVRGQGGEGKTAVAAEFARWMVRSHQMRRAAFVSIEAHGNERSVVDALGRQLVKRDFSAAGDLDKAIQEVERALREQPTLLVMDNMESILLPTWLETSETISDDARRELDAILKLCARLNVHGDTRLLFTSRESLPAPFEAKRHERELRQMEPEDAVKLVERVLNLAGQDSGASRHATRDEIEQLAELVHCHARTLVLFAPAIASRGVESTRESLIDLMAEMERKLPGSREKSVFASVELSLRRMSDANRNRVHVLGVFHGIVDLKPLCHMTQWEPADVISLADELIETGLATPTPYHHLILNPALCPYLRARMDAAERAKLTESWVATMRNYVAVLTEKERMSAEIAGTLTRLELPNLFALLDLVRHAGNAEATIELTSQLYGLLHYLGKPRLLERLRQARDVAALTLGDNWNHVLFDSARIRIDRQLADGQLQEAFEGAHHLLNRTRALPDRAYPNVDYDRAMACLVLACVLQKMGGAEQALPLLHEARALFEAVATVSPGRGAERMAQVCLSDQGRCLNDLGRLDESIEAHQEAERRAMVWGNTHSVAVGEVLVGSVRLKQGRYPEALAAFAQARERFTNLHDYSSVASAWHMTGRAHALAGQPQAAEDAFRASLAISVRLGNVLEQASTLSELGLVYAVALNRLEEAVEFFQQAANKFIQIGDVAGEGAAKVNLANAMCRLGRLDDARQEAVRAIECESRFGSASQPWKSWDVLAAVELAAGNAEAAGVARSNAVASILAYRREGGQNQTAQGRLVIYVIERLRAADPHTALKVLQQFAAEPELFELIPFIRGLEAIVAGSRDRVLADAPGLQYSMSAELLFLIETLEQQT